VSPRFKLKNLRTGRYLNKSGWDQTGFKYKFTRLDKLIQAIRDVYGDDEKFVIEIYKEVITDRQLLLKGKLVPYTDASESLFGERKKAKNENTLVHHGITTS